MSEGHRPEDSIGIVSHYFSNLSVAAVSLTAPLQVGETIHVRGHTTDFVQTVDSMEVEHARVSRAGPGDDVAMKVVDHVCEHDWLYREA